MDVINPNTTTLSSPLTQSGVYSYTYWVPSRRHGDGGWWTDNYWPYGLVNLDPATGNLYYTGFQWSYGYYQYGGILPEYLMEYVDSTGQAKVLPAQMDHSGLMGVGAAYDPSNGLIYFAGWYETQYAPFYTYDRLYSFNPATNTTTDLGPMPNYNADDPLPNVNDINGHILVTNGSIYEYHPSSNTYTPAPFETAVVDSQLNQYAVPGATFYDSNFAWANYASNGGGQLSYGLSSKGPTLNVKYFPYWTFQQDMPSYVPSSLFPQQAVASDGGFWTESGNAPNGTAFFETNFDLPTAQTVTISNPLGNANDYEVVYIDGVPVLQNGNSAGTIPSQPGTTTGTSIRLSLPAGLHQVILEGVNTNGFRSPSPNAAAVGLQIVSQSGQTLVSNSASSWMTTGYVQQLPAGWFSGAIGTFNWTEYILQENPSQPIDQQQTYTIQSTPSTVAEQSSPVTVTWFNPVNPPDNFTLQALPTKVTYPGQTLFKTAFDPSNINFVNQEFHGTAKVIVRAVQTWQTVASGTWTPSSNGTWISMPYTPVGGTSLQYVAELVDPSKGVPVAMSNQVTVTDTGNGIAGSSYTTTSCSAQGNGTEIFNTYTNGKLTSTKTLPLTMQNLEVDGIFNPTATLKSELGTVGKVTLPVKNSQLGYGVPIPLRVQAPFAFAIQFPNAQPTSVTATLTVNEGDAVDMNGDTSWTVKMHPAMNLPYGFWEGDTIMPKLPDGDHISISITATDDCGSASTPTGVFPYNDFVTTNGRPQWYFVQPSKP
ncbi:hypothetical protein LLE49_26325 [Alicyclobacillus tolerans]|uniref:hypothetical protein n=1 Tax=Alicyclobacillus tolerans TaxID=90970 RepID=UPI001F16C9CF|nr:hypothetical protein [Alicyclobacillus tolerans]MCF8568243.1 hypothetical protein [Alicyclobacillus tolerans]